MVSEFPLPCLLVAPAGGNEVVGVAAAGEAILFPMGVQRISQNLSKPTRPSDHKEVGHTRNEM